MCGIWARATVNRSILADELIYPIASLAHRGPDGYGVYYDEKVALVHTRLSIIDLTGGQQPLVSSDRRFLGIVNGELYDYKSHRQRLESKGVQFKTKSDSEVLLNLFAVEGEKGLEKASGEFAFIFYDKQNQKLFFGRDLHGVKPLFFLKNQESISIASEMKALSQEKLELDETYLKQFLIRQIVPPRTSFKDVFHVLPGRIYQYDIKTHQLNWRYFIHLPFTSERVLHEADAVERTRDELENAVKRRLVADVEVGCYLSGGIDSALIAATMVKLGATPRAFTVGFAEKDFDESEKAARIAKHLGISHNVVTLEGKEFLKYLKRSVIAFENPCANPHGAPKNLLSEFASRQVKVVLSGEGADEWFGGYAYLRIKKLKEFIEKHPRVSGQAMQRFIERENGMSMKHLDGLSSGFDKDISSYFGGMVPAQFGRLPQTRLASYLIGSSPLPLILQSCADLSNYMQEDLVTGSTNLSEFDLDLWVGLRTDLLHYILANVGDRQEMSNSLEGRTPFLEKDLAQVACLVNQKNLLRRLQEKKIIRMLAEDLLPKASVNEPKRPFFSPMKYLFQRTNYEEMNDYIKIAKENSLWLPWKNLDHLVYKSARSLTKLTLGGPIISLRLTLFSVGLLCSDLWKPQLTSPRGYTLPNTAQEIIAVNRGENIWL